MAKLCIKVPFEWWHKHELDYSPFSEDWFPLDNLVQYVMSPIADLEEIPPRYEHESQTTIYRYLYRVNGHDLPRTFKHIRRCERKINRLLRAAGECYVRVELELTIDRREWMKGSDHG